MKKNFDFNNPILLKEMQEQLYEQLLKGDLINVTNLRGIGKTYTLIKSAREKGNCIIVEPTRHQAEIIKKEFNYDNVYSQDDLYIRNKKIFIDESVNIKKVKDEMNCEILGGYYINTNNNEDLTFNEEVVINFKKEAKELNKSLRKARDENNYSMYKNLINSYRDVVKMIQDLDWQLKYSEYRLDDENGQKQVAIWEQNGDGQIRKHKIWNIKDKNDNKIKLPKEVKETIDFCKSVGYTKYSMVNLVDMPNDFPEQYNILNDYFFSNHDNYLKAILFDNYYCE